MEPVQIISLFLIAIGGGFVQRVSGFGLGIFVMMFLPHILPSHGVATAIPTLLSCCTTVFNSIKNRAYIAYKTAVPMLIAALISIPIAVYFSSQVSVESFEFLLGIVLVVLSIYFLVFNNRIKFKPTVFNGVISGTLGGVLGGLFSTGGPPAVLYLTNATEDKLIYFATIQFYFAVTTFYTTVMRAINGIITRQVLLLAMIGFVGALLGNFLGGIVFDKLDSNKIKHIVYIGMIISGVIMLF